MEQNASLSLLPPAGGNIMAMRGGAVMQGGNVPVGFDPNVSVIQLPPSANHVPIVDMKGGDETLPIAAAATVALAPAAEGAKNSPVKPKAGSNDPIRFILFDKEFNAFSPTPNEANKEILALLGNIGSSNPQDALQQIYDGIVKLGKEDVLAAKYQHFKQLLINMALAYAKEKKELKEEIVRPELTEITLAFPDKKVVVTLTIKCDQRPSCIQKNLSMAAAATAMLQKGGATIQLFGETYQFPIEPQSTDNYKKLLNELEANTSTHSSFDENFQVALLKEIYNGCFTDGPIISRAGCEHFGLLLEKLGEKYAEKMKKMMARKMSSKKNGETSRNEMANGDLVFTFTFLKFGKLLDEAEQEEISKKVKKSANAQSIGAKFSGAFSGLFSGPPSNQVSTYGMVNRNNACFCISVIQFLFSIPQIRTAIKDHGCKDEVLTEILTQIQDPNYEIAEVNNNGVICALFHLFEELGKDMALFTKLTKPEDLKAGTPPVPYEYLGYIMKSFFTKLHDPNGFGNQEAARDFLQFLFDVFDESGIHITDLFNFTINSTRETKSEAENALFWPLQLERDASNNISTFPVPSSNKTRPKQLFSTTLTRQEEYGGEMRNVTDTIELKNNPYLLIQTSIKSTATGEIMYKNNGEFDLNEAGKPKRFQGVRYDDVDLAAIPLVFTVGNKTFKKFGSIQYNGHEVVSAEGKTDTRGHYIYTRYDLSSTKGIVYDDRNPRFYPDISTVSNPFPDYVLVYAEIGQKEKEAQFDEDVKRTKKEILTKEGLLITKIHDDIKGESDAALESDFGKLLGKVNADASANTNASASGGGSTLLFDKIFKEFPKKLSSHAKRKRNPRTELATKDEDVIEVMSDEMKKAKASYMESTDNSKKKEALVTYATFSILMELMDDIKPIQNSALQLKEVIAASKEKAAAAAEFKRNNPLLEKANAEVVPIPTEIAAAAAVAASEENEEVSASSAEDRRAAESHDFDEKEDNSVNMSSSSVTAPSSDELLKKIKVRLGMAKIVKDNVADGEAVKEIKKQLGMDPSIDDKMVIMDKIIEPLTILFGQIEDTDKNYNAAQLDYITTLVIKSKIHAQLNPSNAKYANVNVSHDSADKIAKQLISDYDKITNNDKLSIEKMAEKVMEKKYHQQLLNAPILQKKAKNEAAKAEDNRKVAAKAAANEAAKAAAPVSASAVAQVAEFAAARAATAAKTAAVPNPLLNMFKRQKLVQKKREAAAAETLTQAATSAAKPQAQSKVIQIFAEQQKQKAAATKAAATKVAATSSVLAASNKQRNENKATAAKAAEAAAAEFTKRNREALARRQEANAEAAAIAQREANEATAAAEAATQVALAAAAKAKKNANAETNRIAAETQATAKRLQQEAEAAEASAKAAAEAAEEAAAAAQREANAAKATAAEAENKAAAAAAAKKNANAKTKRDAEVAAAAAAEAQETVRRIQQEADAAKAVAEAENKAAAVKAQQNANAKTKREAEAAAAAEAQTKSMEDMIKNLIDGKYENKEELDRVCGKNCELWWTEAYQYAKDHDKEPEQKFVLGLCYFWGRGGVEKNDVTAFNLFKKIKLPIAKYYLGLCYFLGNGVKKDVQQAANLFEDAANSGLMNAQYYLGICYQLGQGRDKNIKKAKELFQQAANQGHKDAIQKLKILQKGGRRTLRAAKKRTLRAAKRTLRAANKKRTLRVSKKLRRSTPSK